MELLPRNPEVHRRLAEADRRRGQVFLLHSELWDEAISHSAALDRLAGLMDATRDVPREDGSLKRLSAGTGPGAAAAQFLELVAGRSSTFDLLRAVRCLSVEDRGVISGWLCSPWTGTQIKPFLPHAALAGMSTATTPLLREDYREVRDRIVEIAPALANVRIAVDRDASIHQALHSSDAAERYFARFLLDLQGVAPACAFALAEALPHWSSADTAALAGWSSVPWLP